MKFRFTIVSATVAAAALLFAAPLVTTVFAHAVITEVAWDDPYSPTKLTATSGEDDISADAGSFYLKVFDGDGHQVDKGDTAVISAKEMAVSVEVGLAPGEYRVDWLTASADDGDAADGSLTIEVLAPGATASTPMPAAADHHHDDETEGSPDSATTAAHEPHASLTAPVSFEVTLSGANEVPAVTSPVGGHAHFTFDPRTAQLHYDLTVTGVSPNLITAAHIHRAPAGSNGPGAFPIADAGFTQISGDLTLTDADVDDLLDGNFYVNVHSVDDPGGAARGQLIVPASVPTAITPPSTGDAGLATAAATSTYGLLLALAVVGVSGAGVLALARRRA